jgi:hypothetical protein
VQFVAIVPVGESWVCYSWDFLQRHFSLVDPLGYGKTDAELQIKHFDIHTLLLPVLKEMLRSIRVEYTFGLGTWSHMLHTTLGVHCPR